MTLPNPKWHAEACCWAAHAWWVLSASGQIGATYDTEAKAKRAARRMQNSWEKKNAAWQATISAAAKST